MLRRLERSVLLLILCLVVTGHLWAHERVGIAAVQIQQANHGSDHDHPTTIQSRPLQPSPMVAIPEELTLDIPVKSRNPRDEIAFGALRIDEDVGLYNLLLTYLI